MERTDPDARVGAAWRYLRVATATVAGGAAVAVGIGAGLDAVATTFGGGMLAAAGVGVLGLLAFLGATTAEPGADADATAEPLIATGNAHEKGDHGFAVSHALLWVSVGMIVGGAVGVWTVF